LIVAVALFILAVPWAGAPPAAMAACANTATFAESAQRHGAAVFTGRAIRERPESGDIVFAVDRWFKGPHAARVVLLPGYSAFIAEPPEAGVIQATLAMVVSGDAISLVLDQPVLLVATSVSGSGAFAPATCSIGAVPLDSDEGRDVLAAAVALFGPGRPASDLPATDALDTGATDSVAGPAGAGDWRPMILAAVFAAGLILVGRRIPGRQRRAEARPRPGRDRAGR
jgi:hypothetical protein